MTTPDRKVRKLMEEYQKSGKLRAAALNADLDEKTARKYLKLGKLPSQVRKAHIWRTREDPFKGHWSEAEAMLEVLPELEAKEIFEWIDKKSLFRRHGHPPVGTDLKECFHDGKGSNPSREVSIPGKNALRTQSSRG